MLYGCQNVLPFYGYYSPVWTRHSLFIHSSPVGHLGCLHLWLLWSPVYKKLSATPIFQCFGGTPLQMEFVHYLVTMGHFFFFPFLATLWHMDFLGQGSNPSHSFDLSCSCSNNARSLTHCARPGIEPVSQGSQDAADPFVPQGALCYVPLLRTGQTVFHVAAEPRRHGTVDETKPWRLEQRYPFLLLSGCFSFPPSVLCSIIPRSQPTHHVPREAFPALPTGQAAHFRHPSPLTCPGAPREPAGLVRGRGQLLASSLAPSLHGDRAYFVHTLMSGARHTTVASECCLSHWPGAQWALFPFRETWISIHPASTATLLCGLGEAALPLCTLISRPHFHPADCRGTQSANTGGGSRVSQRPGFVSQPWSRLTVTLDKSPNFPCL